MLSASIAAPVSVPVPAPAEVAVSQRKQPNLLTRNDTILGVCEAIGQDFGFNPNWLRIALASLIYFAPVAVIGTYFGLGALVALTRWIAPDGREVTTSSARPASATGATEDLRLAA